MRHKTKRKSGFLPVISLLLVCAWGVTRGPGAESTITHQARSLQPGEVVYLTFASPEPVEQLTGTVFGKTFLFYSSRDPRVWHGLIGIDLETRSGRYTVDLHGVRRDGTDIYATHLMEIRDKKFPTRRLTVEEKYVTPPPELEERIRRESKRVEEIFATVTPQKKWRGPFGVPVPGQANSNFGKRSILNGKPRSPHTGIDFTADAGTPVKAPNAGRIVLAGSLYFSGNTVIVDHGLGLYSFFAHLSAFTVHEGDEVKAGDVVGRVGSTGRSTGPHLHWTVRLVGTRVDPLSLIGALSPR